MLLLLICIKFSHIIHEEQKYERRNETQEINMEVYSRDTMSMGNRYRDSGNTTGLYA